MKILFYRVETKIAYFTSETVQPVRCPRTAGSGRTNVGRYVKCLYLCICYPSCISTVMG